MTVSIKTVPISLLLLRMQHDMMMRGLGPQTQKDYIRHVKRLAAFLGRPPDTATEEDLRSFQLMRAMQRHQRFLLAPELLQCRCVGIAPEDGGYAGQEL
jgi:hypothetical protein